MDDIKQRRGVLGTRNPLFTAFDTSEEEMRSGRMVGMVIQGVAEDRKGAT